MRAGIIDGKAIAEEVREKIAATVKKMVETHGRPPGLAAVLVGEDPASQIYVSMKEKACAKEGIYSERHNLPETTSQEDLISLVKKLNKDLNIDGILVQLPLPGHIKERDVIEAIDPSKDVDGLHPVNVGRMAIGDEDCFKPCTPYGVQYMLNHSGNDPSGKHVVVVGRSNLVGKPLAIMLMQKAKGANATVTVCHSRTADLAAVCKSADILITAIGRAEMISKDMVKPDAVVIDVGTNRVDDPTTKRGYRLTGDVKFDEVSEVASQISPVPGGVGPMTIAMLLSNTLRSAQKRLVT